MTFPAVGTDRKIQWLPQNSFGTGLIEIGQEKIFKEELKE
jgi:hypothetical protein